MALKRVSLVRSIGSLQMELELISNIDIGVYFVCPFGPIIPQDYVFIGGLSHLTSDRGEGY